MKKVIGIQFEIKDLERIDETAKKESRTRSNFIRHHLMQIVEQLKNGK